MKEFFDKVLAFITANTLPCIIGASAVVFLIVAIIIIVCVNKSKKKAKAKKVEIKQPLEELQPKEETKNEILVEETVVKDSEKVENKKPVSTKKTAKKPEKKQKESKILAGKWVIEFKKDKEYLAQLCASNGEVMLTSETYTTIDGAKEGIQSIINGVENGKFVIYTDKNSNYYYKLKNSNNRLMCVGEIYKSKEQCEKAVQSVKRIAKISTLSDKIIESMQYVDYVPEVKEGYQAKKGLQGKWKIEKNEQGAFSAKLYASNGQLMLATEEVSKKANAEKAIESVKKNSLAGNFIIDKDKFGRFYYKLRNAQKSVICIGEAYESLDSCINALESVRRFANTAIIVSE